jgi:hypothetical protein
MRTLFSFLVSFLVWAFLSACTKEVENSKDASDVSAQLESHSNRMQFQVKQTELLNLPEGPDYKALLSLYEKSGLPEEDRLLYMGSTIVGSHDDAKVTSRPSQSLEEGLLMLEKASSENSVTGRIAVDLLGRYFEKGVGIKPDMALLPQPEIAQCWRKLLRVLRGENSELAGEKATAQNCIALRQKQAASAK